MLCPKCNYENKNTNINCIHCGYPLVDMNQIELNDNKNDNDYTSVAEGIMDITEGVLICGIFSVFILRGSDTETKMVCIPFLVCGIALLIQGIAKSASRLSSSTNTSKASHIAKNLYLIVFFAFCFGALTLYDIKAIMSWSSGGSEMFLFSLMFWFVIIFIIIIKKKNNK